MAGMRTVEKRLSRPPDGASCNGIAGEARANYPILPSPATVGDASFEKRVCIHDVCAALAAVAE